MSKNLISACFFKFYWDRAIPRNCGYIPSNLLVMLVSLKKVSTFKWIQIYFFGVLAHSATVKYCYFSIVCSFSLTKVILTLVHSTMVPSPYLDHSQSSMVLMRFVSYGGLLEYGLFLGLGRSWDCYYCCCVWGTVFESGILIANHNS